MEESNVEENEKLLRQHVLFSKGVIRFLKKNSGLNVKDESSDYKPFTTGIGEAILTFSNIFYKDFRKIYYHLHKSLQHGERFKEYFEAFPLNKDSRYFYYYLMRTSLICELAVHCYLDNRNKSDLSYFEVARQCISNCPDMLYFESVGGWSSLQLTASFLVNIGRPLKLIMLPKYIEDKSILTFVDVVQELRTDVLHGGEIANMKSLEMLDSKELTCLEELKDVFKQNVFKVQSGEKRSSSSPKLASRNVDTNEEKIIIKYFKHCQLKAQEWEETVYKLTEDKSTQVCSVSNKDDLANLETEVQEQVDTGVSRRTETDEAKMQFDTEDTDVSRRRGTDGAQKHLDTKDTGSSLRTETDEQPQLSDWVKEFAEAAKKLQDQQSTQRRTCNQSVQTKLNATAESNIENSDGQDDSLAFSLGKSDDSDLDKTGKHGENEENVSASYPHAENRDKAMHASKRVACIENIFSESSSPKKQIKLDTKLGHSSLLEQSTLPPKQTTPATIGEASCSRANESGKAVDKESDIKHNFVIPQEYIPYVGSSDEYKFLYSAKMYPPSKREKLDEPLKAALDKYIINRNYKQMASGDIFVYPSPGSAQNEETLVIFVDSSTDDETSEDTYKFICHFKKIDVDFEGKRYNLRPREDVFEALGSKELTGTGAEPKKQEAGSPGAISRRSQRSKLRSKIDARDEAVYTKYLTKLYKKYLPAAIDECLKALLSDTRSDVGSTPSEQGALFVITPGLLAKRKVQLKEVVGEIEDLLGVPLNKSNPELKILSSNKRKMLDFFIERQIYDIVEEVCLVGFLRRTSFSDMNTCLLFPPADKNSNKTEYRKEIGRLFYLYKNAIISRPEANWMDHFNLATIACRLDYFCNKLFTSLTG